MDLSSMIVGGITLFFFIVFLPVLYLIRKHADALPPISLSKLSERVEIRPNNRSYTIVSMPIGMEMQTVRAEKSGEDADVPPAPKAKQAGKKKRTSKNVRDEKSWLTRSIEQTFEKDKQTMRDLDDETEYELPVFTCPDPPPLVVVVDLFSVPCIQVFPRVFSHGEIVTRILTDGLADRVAVLAIDISCGSATGFHPKAAIEAFTDLLRMQRSGTRIVAVNCSYGFKSSFRWISSLAGKRIDEKTVRESGSLILDKDEVQRQMFSEVEYVKRINRLIGSGVVVYEAVDNGEVGFDELSDAKTIGALDAKGNIILPFSFKGKKPGDVPFIDIFAKGVYVVRPFRRQGGRIGSGDEGIFFDRKEWAFRSGKLKGTSFASPRALNALLKEKFKKEG